ncbi:MAG TPA: head GIN domain-containing protein [Chitinophagaceae bacterium]|nr:head GIN domain-containing protein [Chitinophagaceae bacterium]
MKKILFCLFLTATGLAATAQKPINDPNAEKRNVSGFHAIEVGWGIDLFLSQGAEAVAVSAGDTKFRDRIKTEVVNGVLKISYDWDKGLKFSLTKGKMMLRAYVSCPDMDRLNASGGSDVFVEGLLKLVKLDLHVSGGSDFKGKVDIANLKANASGGSDIVISGVANNLDVHASGGSDFEGYALTVENCIAQASGGSDITITATKEINVQSSGGSDIHYKGGAVIRNIKTSGGGSVKKTS